MQTRALNYLDRVGIQPSSFQLGMLQRIVAGLSAWSLSACGNETGRTRPFDDIDYKLSFTLKTPMDTIAGLTDWAQDINYVYGVTTAVLIFVFFSVAIPLLIIIAKFRVRPEEAGNLPLPKQFHGHPVLEVLWSVIPAVLLIFIAYPTWQAIFRQPVEAPEGAMEIRVIGHQWWWEFQYPSLGITTANELHMPESTPVFFRIRSADVIHSFWIPQFGGKVDALPFTEDDRYNHMFITTPALQKPELAEKNHGEFYQGQCVELCGPSHALMRFQAVLHSKAQFDGWAKAHNKPPVVESELAKKGEAVFVQCQVCHTIAGTPSEDLEKQILAANPGAGKAGPNLSTLGSRRYFAAGTRLNTLDNLKLWIRDPQALKPGALMTKLALSEEELEAVATYVQTSTAKLY